MCGRWDLNPHKRNAYKILSLARLPVPTLPHLLYNRRCRYVTYVTRDLIILTLTLIKINTFLQLFCPFLTYYSNASSIRLTVSKIRLFTGTSIPCLSAISITVPANISTSVFLFAIPSCLIEGTPSGSSVLRISI